MVKDENKISITQQVENVSTDDLLGKEFKKISRKIRINKIISIILILPLLIVIFFNVYICFDAGVVFNKPDLEITQKKIDESIDKDEVKNDTSNAESFALYSVGDKFFATNGSSSFTVDIRNVSNSSHDIVVSFYISQEELEKHGITIDEKELIIAKSGRFEPGYLIEEVLLNKLPDGSVLPKGKYDLTLSEVYYHHTTGVMSSYEARIPVTLEVLN